MKIWGYTLHPSGLRPGFIVSSSYKKPGFYKPGFYKIYTKLLINGVPIPSGKSKFHPAVGAAALIGIIQR